MEMDIDKAMEFNAQILDEINWLNRQVESAPEGVKDDLLELIANRTSIKEELMGSLHSLKVATPKGAERYIGVKSSSEIIKKPAESVGE